MRYRGFDLNLLVTLDALIREASVSRAAARLNVSQPAMSAALSRLRRQFNDPLLHADGKRMRPTPRAIELAEMLHAVMERLDTMVFPSTTFDPAQSRHFYRIGASDYVAAVLLTPLFASLQRIAPGIRMQIFQSSLHVREMFARGEVDMMLAPEGFTVSGHPTRLLFEERHVVVGAADNPIFDRPLDEDAFYAAGHIAVELGPEQGTTFAERQLGLARRARRIEVVAPSFSAVPWMLPGTNRLAVMHERLALALAPTLPLKLVPMPFPFPLMREMAQVHRDRAHDPAISWLLQRMEARAQG